MGLLFNPLDISVISFYIQEPKFYFVIIEAFLLTIRYMSIIYIRSRIFFFFLPFKISDAIKKIIYKNFAFSFYRVHILEAINMADRQATFLCFPDLSTCNLLNEKYHAVQLLTVFQSHLPLNKYLKTGTVSQQLKWSSTNKFPFKEIPQIIILVVLCQNASYLK